MADRVLRGSRLGAVSYETDRNHDLAPRQSMRYACPRGHDFEVPFANDAEPPATWECRLHGSISRLVDGNEPEQKKVKPPRTHWDMLLERRSVADLEVLARGAPGAAGRAACRDRLTRNENGPSPIAGAARFSCPGQASSTWPSRRTTGGCVDHGKLIHSPVRRQTYSHDTVLCGFS